MRGLFREFHRDNRSLSLRLHQRFLRPALEGVRQLPPGELARPTEELVRHIIENLRVTPPRLLGQERASAWDGKGTPRPTSSPGTRVPTTRHHVALQVEGDLDLLEYWPDAADDGLRPVDAFEGDPWERSGPGEPYDLGDELRKLAARDAADLWFLGLRGDERTQALYTWLDLTLDDERAIARGERDPAAEVNAQRERIEPIVVAISAQTLTFFDSELPSALARAIDAKREEVDVRDAVVRSLSWPVGWKQSEPQLEPATPPEVVPKDSNADGPRHVVAELSMPPPSRLANASFIDVQRTMRVWADAVERHPRPYQTLGEEPLSDLLAATLNAALPGAHREVYSRGGRSDVYIRGDALSTGVAPAKVFICECKMWDGAAKAEAALEQLFGYLDNKDTAAVLLFFVRHSTVQKVRRSGADALTERSDFVGTEEPAVEGWPILRFRVAERHVHVCVAFVDITAASAAS